MTPTIDTPPAVVSRARARLARAEKLEAAHGEEVARAEARVRAAEREVAHAEDAAGRAHDAVLLGQQLDDEAERRALATAQAVLGEARAALDAVHGEAEARSEERRRAQAAIRCAETQAHVDTVRETAAALEAAASALVEAFQRMRAADADARGLLLRLAPGVTAGALPALNLGEVVAQFCYERGADFSDGQQPRFHEVISITDYVARVLAPFDASLRQHAARCAPCEAGVPAGVA